MSNAPIDLAEKLSSFTDHWSPKVVARLNDYEIKVVKVQGEFVWQPMTTPMNCSSSSTES